MSGASIHDGLLSALDLGIILLTARFAGLGARRIGQPAVIGEVLAGILLGPTILGLLPGNPPAALFTAHAVAPLTWLGTIGLIGFVFTIGLEFDWRRLPRSGNVAMIAALSFGLPFCAGLAVAASLYGGHHIVDHRRVGHVAFLVFVAAVMSISAFPVLVRILDEHRLRRTPLGALAIACAVVNDTIGWLAISAAIVAFGASQHSWTLPLMLAEAVAFLLGLKYILGPAICRLSGAGSRDLGPLGLATVMVAGLGGCAAATEAMGLHYIFGAFAFGLLVSSRGSSALRTSLVRGTHVVVATLLPIYLVMPGLAVNLRSLNPGTIGEVVLVLTVASAAKIVGGAAPARLTGLKWRDAIALGTLLNTRGLMELVALNIGRSLGILDSELYAVLLIMALATTVATSPALRVLKPIEAMNPRRVV